MKVRINNIEFRKYTSTKTTKPLYEIVKWEPNPYYGKKQQYLDNDYKLNFEGWGLTKDGHTIDLKFFDNVEGCFTIAFIEKGSESWELRSVGERLLDLTPEEWNDFHSVYTLGQAKLHKK